MQLEMTLSLTEKFCTRCREYLPVSSFGLNSRTPDRLHHWCKPCINSVNRDYKHTPEGKRAAQLARDRYNRRAVGEDIPRPHPKRAKAPKGQGKTSREYIRRYREENVSFLRVLKSSVGCQVCGETDPVCLEFHHRDPKMKSFNLANNNAGTKPTSVLIEEILKCTILCANCHRKVHAGSFDVAHLPRLTRGMVASLVNIDSEDSRLPQLGE